MKILDPNWAKSRSSGIPLKWVKVMFENSWKSRLSEIPLKCDTTVDEAAGLRAEMAHGPQVQCLAAQL